ncbi:MAG: DUF3987 domain-containing protein [Candidatus Methanosuratincola sp.]
MGRKCKEGFVKTYVDYAHNQESPPLFHKWVALSTIACVIGRRVWMSSGGNEEGYYTIYPNLYLLLVSPSGVGRKSTAIELGFDLIEKSGIQLNIIKGKITPAKLMEKLVQAEMTNEKGLAEVVVFSSEFRVFTKGIMVESSLIEDLTHLYDCKRHSWETKHEGTYVIEKPCVNLLAASTPEWLTGGTAGDIMSGGLGSRLTPVATTTLWKKIAWAKKTRDEMEKEEWLVHDLAEIRKLEGQFYITPEAERVFEEWYVTADEYRNHDPRLDAYYNKKHDQVRKVAMLLSLSQNDDLAVNERHVQAALMLFKELEKTITYAYSSVSWGESGKFNEKVLLKIKEMGERGITHSELMRAFHFCMDKEMLRKVVATLLHEESITYEIVETKTKPKVVYRYVEREEEKGV